MDGTSGVQTITGDDFANVPAEACPTPKADGDITYSVSIACKTAQTYVSSTGSLNGKPVRAAVGGRRDARRPDAAHRDDHLAVRLQPQNQVTVVYTDTYPFLGDQVHDMQLCKLDPRNADGSLDTSIAPGDVLRPPTRDRSRGDFLPDRDDRSRPTAVYRAYVYSSVDGLRTIG